MNKDRIEIIKKGLEKDIYKQINKIEKSNIIYDETITSTEKLAEILDKTPLNNDVSDTLEIIDSVQDELGVNEDLIINKYSDFLYNDKNKVDEIVEEKKEEVENSEKIEETLTIEEKDLLYKEVPIHEESREYATIELLELGNDLKSVTQKLEDLQNEMDDLKMNPPTIDLIDDTTTNEKEKPLEENILDEENTSLNSEPLGESIDSELGKTTVDELLRQIVEDINPTKNESIENYNDVYTEHIQKVEKENAIKKESQSVENKKQSEYMKNELADDSENKKKILKEIEKNEKSSDNMVTLVIILIILIIIITLVAVYMIMYK